MWVELFGVLAAALVGLVLGVHLVAAVPLGLVVGLVGPVAALVGVLLVGGVVDQFRHGKADRACGDWRRKSHAISTSSQRFHEPALRYFSSINTA